MKKLSLILIFATLAITGWSLNKSKVYTPAKETVNVSTSNVFSFFNAHREGRNGAGLIWKSSATANVASYQIERSYDGEYFDPVAGQPENHASVYMWKDTNVFPGYIYYRVAATLSNGEVVYSDVAMVHIVQH